MAKYGRFDPRNKKRGKDKYRSEKKKPNGLNAESNNKNAENAYLREIEKAYQNQR